MSFAYDDSNITDDAHFDWKDGEEDVAFSAKVTDQVARRRDDESDKEDEAIECMAKNVMNLILLHEEEQADGQQDNILIMMKRRHQFKKQRAIWVDDDGSVRRISPRQTVWYSVYILKPDLEDPKFHKIFRRRFRLLFAQFLDLGDRLEAHEIFARWHSRKVNPLMQEPLTPIPLFY